MPWKRGKCTKKIYRISMEILTCRERLLQSYRLIRISKFLQHPFRLNCFYRQKKKKNASYRPKKCKLLIKKTVSHRQKKWKPCTKKKRKLSTKKLQCDSFAWFIWKTFCCSFLSFFSILFGWTAFIDQKKKCRLSSKKMQYIVKKK